MDFNVADLIERVAGNIPDREAVICGEQRATYQQLQDNSQRFAAFLLSLGLAKGDHVAIYSYNSIEWVEAMLGCYQIGAVPININYRYVENELHYIFNDADIKAVVYQPRFAERLANIAGDLPLLQHFIHFEDEQGKPLPGSHSFVEACNSEPDVTFPERSGDDIYVLYTGGTTGMPKGVVWRQHDVIMSLGGGVDMQTQEPIGSPEAMADRCIQENAFYMRSLQMAPLMHGAAQWGLLRALFEGHTVVMSDKTSFDPHEVWQLVEQEKVNTLLVTGDAMAKPMLDALESGNYDVSSLFVFASSAAVFSPVLKDRYSELLPNVIIMDNIGSSESGYTGATVHEKGKAESNVGGPRVNPGKGTVVLDENLNIIPAGDPRQGMLAKGGFIPQSYYKDADKTAKTFVTAADGQRYSIPGDMAKHNADGTITMLGRGSLCINSGGEKIYPEEVEMAVKAHPEVYDCLVVGTPDERFGSAVTALIQMREGASEPDLEAIQKACEPHIARYKLPRRLMFVDQIKRSPSGKPDYKWAKEAALEVAFKS